MGQNMKEENMEPSKEEAKNQKSPSSLSSIISLSSSSSSNFDGFDSGDSDLDDWDIERNLIKKKQRIETVLPVGFLDPLTSEERLAIQNEIAATSAIENKCQDGRNNNASSVGLSNVPIEVKKETFKNSDNVSKDKAVSSPAIRSCKQFWKAGDYEGKNDCDSGSRTVGMDHVRVHPKFLHSNATSHKWALGAFAELLDNALDEVCNGATYVHIDVLNNRKDNDKMLSIEDNGGGMNPDKMRQCMSLGYSEKSKMANTIGQCELFTLCRNHMYQILVDVISIYLFFKFSPDGNGFKTSTMRLGADVIVFSRCRGTDGRSTTQSIGMLSYTFLTETGKEDIVVPMIDYEKRGAAWNKMVRFSLNDWERNFRTIVQWSPYGSEEDLLQQFNSLKDQGTRIIIYNLWEDDQGALELDFDTNQHDIQIRGVSRDEKKIEMAKIYPNSRHFLTYRHSLRNYASILYLRIPPGFQMSLRGKEVKHHNIINDMMQSKEITYRPAATDVESKDQNMVAVGTIGFVKDAKCHIDVQGFNVYHKNRLIKPFWRVWNAAGSDGRGVIGVLEANFVEPAHDKQGFERTAVLGRLEARLNYIQKNYWSSNCHLIGYAPRRHPKNSVSPEKVAPALATGKSCSRSKPKERVSYNVASVLQSSNNNNHGLPADATENVGATRSEAQARNRSNTFSINGRPQVEPLSNQITQNTEVVSRDAYAAYPSTTEMVLSLTEENNSLRKSLEEVLQNLKFERDRIISLQNQLKDTHKKLEKSDKEREVFVSSLAEERSRRDQEEVRLRERIKDASETIQGLLHKIKMLDNRGV
ncbi:Histidine kinase [Abeliophyllum distichum]|uniref:Histidine kinase n=1 Tax=Abeliophyllum distichum TaxID=126358 RepID=A0ABD1U407_9LAMI